MNLGVPFKRVKTCHNGSKVIFLLIKTYFSEYLRPERPPQLGVVLVRPLLDDGLKGGNSERPERASSSSSSSIYLPSST